MTEFEFDCLQKKRTAQGSHNRVGHSHQVRLPSDGLSPKALVRYNGPCRTYRLGRPMDGAAFAAMPRDLQRLYLRKLRYHGATEEGVRQLLDLSPQDLLRLRQAAHVTFDRPDGQAWAAFLKK